jgi:hypothetical protein
VEDFETRDEPQAEQWVQTYGTIDCGLELMTHAWQTMQHVFSVEHKCAPRTLSNNNKVEPTRHKGPRYSMNLLNNTPVDVLVLERSHIRHTRKVPQPERWEALIDNTCLDQRPQVLIEVWQPVASTWESGPTGKLCMVRWDSLGYNTRVRQVNATAVGGAIHQPRLIVTRMKRGAARRTLWDPFDDCATADERPRPMSNLLTPPGLVPRKFYTHGTPHRGIDAETSAMPAYLTWIKTSKGVRRLMPEELARGLGVDKKVADGIRTDLSADLLQQTTSIFHWEYLSDGFVTHTTPQSDTKSVNTATTADETDWSDSESDDDNTAEPFSWCPPSLAIGGAWYRQRFESLILASAQYLDPFPLVREGINILDRHRRNYTATHPDPKELQVIWWEFPREHWDALREGSRMNFLQDPVEGMTANMEMDDEQTEIATQFVEELIDLKVLRRPPKGRPTKCNAPLFILPKAGQKGQWRVIANLLAGGQNAVVGNDPVFLPRVSHIMDQMYRGGYSTVIDASKFFYQFGTHPDDRPFLGMVHPKTGEVLEYCGLPMGAANSPALGGRYGLAFVRMLKKKFAIFQGENTANCYWSGFQETSTYDPDLGYGCVLLQKEGRPSVRIWSFVDDFLVHSSDLESCQEALRLFLDTAVDVGLLCHPGKLIPPQQRVKYCGFLLDTTDIPKQMAPVGKRERALAMTEYVLGSHLDHEFSRLSLAVVTGVLESLVDGTPHRLGHTYLRRMHSRVHPPGMGTGAQPYYSKTTVSELERQELRWWSRTLRRGRGRHARSIRSATLVPTWGDGSGTGTGGTLDLPDQPLKMWLGKWAVVVFKFSSNWKELETLRLTMRQLQHEHPDEVRGTTLFYFTDNSTTYWIAAAGSSGYPKLHALIVDIKLIEQELDCHLQVIHVPGLVMITQGTDGLSRGVWMSALHSPIDQRYITQAVFDPVHYDPDLVEHYLSLYDLPRPWRYQDWRNPWDGEQCFDQLTVWFPPPEIARQAISFALETWVERPLTTSALFFVPRTLMAFWHGLSRHLVELAPIYPHKTVMKYPPALPIPITVLYLPCHVRTLPLPRLDTPPLPNDARWHRQQAAHMRGLPPRALS